MHPKYQEAIKLRRKGQSYGEIANILGVSKSSVSSWCQGLKLSPLVQKILEAKTKISFDQLLFYNERRKRIIKIENQKIKDISLKEVKNLSPYELMLIGTALYWGEGYKRQAKHTPFIQFSNSDPAMIKLFLRFLREIIMVPDDKLRVSIRIYPNISRQFSIDFWSEVTNIPKERFYITTQISSASKRKRPKNSLPYGTLDLRARGRQDFCRIMGWINGLIKQT